MALAQRTAEPFNENPEGAIQDLAAANAKIEQLRALLASKETLSRTKTLGPDKLVSTLEAIA
jgi:hypothetical protein